MLSYSDFITKINILSNGRKFVLQFRDNFLFALLRVAVSWLCCKNSFVLFMLEKKFFLRFFNY